MQFSSREDSFLKHNTVRVIISTLPVWKAIFESSLKRLCSFFKKSSGATSLARAERTFKYFVSLCVEFAARAVFAPVRPLALVQHFALLQVQDPIAFFLAHFDFATVEGSVLVVYLALAFWYVFLDVAFINWASIFTKDGSFALTVSILPLSLVVLWPPFAPVESALSVHLSIRELALVHFS